MFKENKMQYIFLFFLLFLPTLYYFYQKDEKISNYVYSLGNKLDNLTCVNSETDTGLKAVIQPRSINSVVRIDFSGAFSSTNNSNLAPQQRYFKVIIKRNGKEILGMNTGPTMSPPLNNNPRTTFMSGVWSVIDSPKTTTPVTYTVSFSNSFANFTTTFYNSEDSSSYLFVQEYQ